MKRISWQPPIYSLALALGTALCLPQPAGARLPELDDAPWVGFFLAHEARRFEFGIDNQAKGRVIPQGRSGNRINALLHLPLSFVVEETMPDGRVVSRQVRTESLETEDPAATSPESVSFRGQVTGEATFEVKVEIDRGVVLIGGRITDPGTLTRNPIRFTIRTGVPSAYRNDDKTTRDFARKVSSDRLTMRMADGSRARQSTSVPVIAASEEINGEGISELIVDMEAYQDRSLQFAASEGSQLNLWNRAEGPLHDGFSINWYHDPEKDPEGNARLRIDVR